MTIPTVGSHIKVYLPGESPWAEVLEVNGPLVKARIVNKLFREYSREEQRGWTGDNFGTPEPLPELHTFKKGDELWFERQGKFNNWQPVSRQ